MPRRFFRAIRFVVWQQRLAAAEPPAAAGSRHDRDGIPVVTLEGSPYQRGLQHGRLMAVELQRFRASAWPYLERVVAARLRLPRRLGAWLARPLLLLLGALYLPKLSADVRAEIQGIADGADLPLREVVLNAVSWEVLAASGNAIGSRLTHCSEIAVDASLSGAAGALLGYNYDLIAEDDRALVDGFLALFVVRPSEGAAYVAPNLIGVPGLNTAMNEHGLAFAWDNSYLRSGVSGASDTRNFMLVLRDLALHAAGTAHAAAQLRREPRPHADICLLAGEQGVAAVELAGSRSALRSGALLWSCNRLQQLAECDYQGAGRAPDARHQRYPELVAALRPPVSVADVAAVLRDQGGAPGRQIAAPGNGFCVIYAPREGRLWLSLSGAPASHGPLLAFDAAGRRCREHDIPAASA